jgi:two-component system alkaline phosphatase synthesis response regulator PhoP
LVDGEKNLTQIADQHLQREGYTTHAVRSGRAALQAVRELHPDMIVLDVMLPELDGFEVCKRLRQEHNNIPILILTARDEDIDKTLGLELGADDYMTKPFNPRELVARIKAILRRSKYRPLQDKEHIRLGDLEIDQDRREVRCLGRLVPFRSREFDVLLVLAEHKGLVLSREQLLNLAWGFDFSGQTRTVDVHVAQLRRKIVNSSLQIETVPGVGYKLVVL